MTYYEYDNKSLGIDEFQESIKNKPMRNLFESITSKTKIRVNIRLDVEMESEEVVKEFGIPLPKIDIMDTESLDWDKAIHNEIHKRFQERELEGPGWNFRKLIGIKKGITKSQP